jgi:hypothetical protein
MMCHSFIAVLAGWIINHPFSLALDPVSVVILTLSGLCRVETSVQLQLLHPLILHVPSGLWTTCNGADCCAMMLCNSRGTSLLMLQSFTRLLFRLTATQTGCLVCNW